MQTFAMTEFFEVSAEKDCNETQYTLTTDKYGAVLLSNSQTASINSAILTIDKSVPASMNFYIFAQTKGRKTAFKEI